MSRRAKVEIAVGAYIGILVLLGAMAVILWR